MFLLDTNVISELMRERPHHHVQKFFAENPATVIWTCSIVVAELLFGVELMPSGRRQRMLSQAIEDMIQEDFRQQILPFNLEAARSYGKIRALRQRMGRPISETDAQIAAIALAHSARLATRNISDFEHCGVTLINPWDK
jgi:predicted nucleic acid-binding protein